MTSHVLSVDCHLPPISEKEVLRYAGDKQASGEAISLLRACIRECDGIFSTKVAYRILPIKRYKGEFSIGGMEIQSLALGKNLEKCDRVILLAACAGIGIDRLIAKYAKFSPARALLFHSIGTERVEALCDSFCEMIQARENIKLAPRFSPGYGDLDLGIQKEILTLLNADKTLGIGLNESLLLSPSKSVTAFAGIVRQKECD